MLKFECVGSLGRFWFKCQILISRVLKYNYAQKFPYSPETVFHFCLDFWMIYISLTDHTPMSQWQSLCQQDILFGSSQTPDP